MIAIDWGTTSFRAARLGPDGAVLDRRTAPAGILQVEGGAFRDTLLRQVGDWLAAGERRVLMSGMIGSRQGWHEVPYLPCPSGAAELAAALAPVPLAEADAFIVPGLLAADPSGVPEVMRGEETQIVGIADEIGGSGLVCLPGTHSKWAELRDGRIVGFRTHMTGEAFAALRGHTILGRLMQGETEDDDAFAAGVARSTDRGGLLHHLFGVRTMPLTGRLREEAVASYLSGLLVGHEIRAALADRENGTVVHLVGSDDLCRRYAEALRLRGVEPRFGRADAAFAGLHKLGAATWS